MKKILCFLAVLAVLSCQKPASETVLPEYSDWYTLKSPVDHAIEGVWGDWDKTLLISTGYAIFRSTNKGQTWQQVHKQSLGMFGVVQYKDTLFTMSGLLDNKALLNPGNYSIDDGQHWQPYRGHNMVFEYAPSLGYKGFPINPVTASNGVSYTINRVFLDGPTATTGNFETPGVVTSDGRRIDLPQLHQLSSLYLDSRERLYLSGSDAVCGRGKDFAFCNSKEGRGVVYVSKRSMP
jgi:hypothetical protein